MGKIKRLFLLSAATGCLLLTAYFAFRALGSLSHGYSQKEMDWNQDGATSIGEFFQERF